MSATPQKTETIRVTHTVVFWHGAKQIGGMALKPIEFVVDAEMLPRIFDLNGWDKKKAGLE